MTKEQKEHLCRLVESFNFRTVVKYENGANEHGGNLWDMDLLQLIDNAIDEAVDQLMYLGTAREKLLKERMGETIKPEERQVTFEIRDISPITQEMLKSSIKTNSTTGTPNTIPELVKVNTDHDMLVEDEPQRCEKCNHRAHKFTMCSVCGCRHGRSEAK